LRWGGERGRALGPWCTARRQPGDELLYLSTNARPTGFRPEGAARGVISGTRPHGRIGWPGAVVVASTGSTPQHVRNFPCPEATGHLWTTAGLSLRTQPRPQAKTAGLLPSGKHVAVTGERRNGYAEVILGRVTRWVTDDYLSKSKERPAGSRGLVDRPCPGTS